MDILLHISELGPGLSVDSASEADLAEVIARTAHLGPARYLVYDEHRFRVVAATAPDWQAKLAQSDVPDTMLALLSALRAGTTPAPG
ncbi:hypothetical protein [Lysobacter silvisoli]|uniref:Uncharacterized protein n=1 Tax=Lysobacter silvisoli TaxID=2293254 RepID=A0A371K2Q1_9GAMM|nr:hypothetical protein [Lysobacter silvisoli]RDZ28209.1 hypothetical protein DX914_03425 [Lysobacter silvisoli]